MDHETNLVIWRMEHEIISIRKRKLFSLQFLVPKKKPRLLGIKIAQPLAKYKSNKNVFRTKMETYLLHKHL